MSQATEPATLLGKAIDDPQAQSFFTSLDPKAKLKKSDLDEPRWISKSAGIEVHADKESRRIDTVFLYSQGLYNFTQYKNPLPHGISFSMTKDQVKACFSVPSNFTSPEHDTWDFDDYRLIVEYGSTGFVKTVTVTTAF